jgi:hypothetical protein
MRTQLASIVLAMQLTAGIAYSAEVDYQFQADSLAALEKPKTAEPLTIAFVDRVWATPGVEQSSENLLPPIKIDFENSPRFRGFRIEASEDCRDVGTCLRYSRVGLEWLDDVAWPLTRELYHLGRPYYRGDDRTEFTFGLITLQR